MLRLKGARSVTQTLTSGVSYLSKAESDPPLRTVLTLACSPSLVWQAQTICGLALRVAVISELNVAKGIGDGLPRKSNRVFGGIVVVACRTAIGETRPLHPASGAGQDGSQSCPCFSHAGHPQCVAVTPDRKLAS